MNDKTNNPQEKIETAIDSDELRDEELEKVAGGVDAEPQDVIAFKTTRAQGRKIAKAKGVVVWNETNEI